MKEFKTGDIVKGIVCGAFVIDSMDKVAGETVYRCHSVVLNEQNQVVSYNNGQMAMPVECFGEKVSSLY